MGGSAVLQEYFGDDEWLYSYASYTGTMKRSMIVTAVSAHIQVHFVYLWRHLL